MTDISHLNTLRIPAKTEKIIEIDSVSNIKPEYFQKSYFILGSGANVLFTKDFPGNIILVKIPGRKVISETENDITLEFGAGENWHEIVKWTVDNNYSGIENIALVPGTIGAAAVGNIAAYGQNQEDIFVSLQATNLKTQEPKTIDKSDMKFAYRDSFLKNNRDYLVTSVTYKLSKKAHLELSYHAAHHSSLLPTLQMLKASPANRAEGVPSAKGGWSLSTALPDAENYTIKDVYNAVIKLRTEKLPDPAKIGTAGSFFKNPVVSKKIAEGLKSKFPDIQTYPVQKLQYTETDEDFVKLPAGFLLDKLGWRGKRIGNVGTYASHALTIVTYPGATGQEVFEFAEQMREDIKKNFDIDLEYEVVIV